MIHLSRPASLFPLFASVTTLPGIGARLGSLIEKKIGPTVLDILRHSPVGVIDRTARPDISHIISAQLVTLEVIITSHNISPRHISRPSRIFGENESGEIEIVFFKADAQYLARSLPIGERRIISGTAEIFNDRVQIAHPDYILSPAQIEQLPSFEPIYPLTAGLKGKILRKAITAAIGKVARQEEWIDNRLRETHNWPAFDEAIKQLHSPHLDVDLSPNHPARERLAYDELLANQLALSLIRQRTTTDVKGKIIAGNGHLRDKLRAQLAFALTNAQERVLAEIFADQGQMTRMLRLIQGDVGSGKTLVALLAMLNAVETGKQAALLAPTEILAKQHYKTINDLLEPLQIPVGLLVGGAKTKAKTQMLEAIQSRQIPVVIGTHALLTDDVHFADLGLAVVDEQHRFGVKQRLNLSEKGGACDVLVMTATPIPRTLSMTAYGDLESSIIDEKPPGRQEIDTRLFNLERLDEIIDKLQTRLSSSMRAYWICPLVEESETTDITSAEERFAVLQQRLAHTNPQLLHGKMKSAEKEQAMALFQSGESQLLVATTVVEVGVDVPEATIMIIEHAERFGLAQLHQLRGRVGRGNLKSSCLLAYKGPLSETATSRLQIMRESNDGFRLAEEDLRLRGPGEILGQRQSGMPEFALVDFAAHAHLIPQARAAADQIIKSMPNLEGQEADKYRVLLSLFEKDNAISYLHSG